MYLRIRRVRFGRVTNLKEGRRLKAPSPWNTEHASAAKLCDIKESHTQQHLGFHGGIPVFGCQRQTVDRPRRD